MTESPFTFREARTAAHNASQRQIDNEKELVKANEAAAAAELGYRKALAQKILLIRAEGGAASVAADIARGDATVADLRFKRDVALGLLEASKAAGFRLGADRRQLEQFVRWSMARELADPGSGA